MYWNSRFDIAYLSKPVQSAAEMTVELINDCLEFVKKIYKQERAVYVFSSDGRSRASVIGICHFIRVSFSNRFSIRLNVYVESSVVIQPI